MQWQDIRQNYPNQWLIIEALEAHTDTKHQRCLDKLSVIEFCADGKTAMKTYQTLYQQYPEREFYFVHTNKTELDIEEHQWLGVRKHHEIETTR